MSDRNSKQEGGLLPLAILLGFILLILLYGVRQGFLNRPDVFADKKVRLVLVAPASSSDAYRDTIRRFEAAHPDIGVDFRPISGSKYYQKLLVMMASGDAPDLMWMGLGFGEFAQRGAFLDIGARIQRDVDVRRFLPQALSWYRTDGHQLGIPFAVDVGFVIYNKDIFDDLGLAYPQDDWDYDQFLDLARRLTLRDSQGRVTRFGYYGGLDPALFGAQFISDDGSHATCDTPEMIAALQTNLDLIYKYRVAPTSQDNQSMDRYFLFASGRAAMMQAYTWDILPLRQQAGDVRWGYVLNPKVRVQTEWASSQAILISSRTKHPEEAWELCREFFSPAFQKNMAAFTLPTDLKVAGELADSGLPRYDHLPTLLKASGQLVPDPRVAHFSEAQRIFMDAQQSITTGQATPRQAMQRASHMIDRTIQLHRRYGS